MTLFCCCCFTWLQKRKQKKKKKYPQDTSDKKIGKYCEKKKKNIFRLRITHALKEHCCCYSFIYLLIFFFYGLSTSTVMLPMNTYRVHLGGKKKEETR